MRHICTSLSRAVETAIFRLPIVGFGDIINTEDSFFGQKGMLVEGRKDAEEDTRL